MTTPPGGGRLNPAWSRGAAFTLVGLPDTSRSASRDRCEPSWSSLPKAGVRRADSVPGTGLQWASHGSRHPLARLGAALICIKRDLDVPHG